MSQAGGNSSGGGGGGGIVTIAGDIGSMTGSSVTIYTNVAAEGSGSTVEFVNSGTISTLLLSDGNGNTVLGNRSGNASITGASNTSVGTNNFTSLTSGTGNFAAGQYALSNTVTDTGNVAAGYASLFSLNGGSYNVGEGYQSLENLSTGSYNTALGQNAGFNYRAAESSNILLQSPGVADESNVMRLGSATGSGISQNNITYITGLWSNIQAPGPGVYFVTLNSNAGSSQDLVGTSAVTSIVSSWVDVTASSQAIQSGTGYITDNATQVSYTLPNGPELGDVFEITGGVSGSATAPWIINLSNSQIINFGNSPATTSLASTLQFDSVRCVCIQPGVITSIWNVVSYVGTLTAS